MIDQLSSPAVIDDVEFEDHTLVHYRRAPDLEITDWMFMPEAEIRRHDSPPKDTVFPLEYAFHLLGDLRGKVVVDLGCGEGTNTIILAALGARVISVDISEVSLEVASRRACANGVVGSVTLVHSDAAGIPIRDAIADHVLCSSALHYMNPIITARQIRRVLRPGGTAVFKEPVVASSVLRAAKTILSESYGVNRPQQPLNIDDIEAVNRAVGRAGRRRPFWLTTRLLYRMGLEEHAITKASQKFDALFLRRFPYTGQFASPLVWEACKES
jgi:SAM-dependent methyltransferase